MFCDENLNRCRKSCKAFLRSRGDRSFILKTIFFIAYLFIGNDSVQYYLNFKYAKMFASPF